MINYSCKYFFFIFYSCKDTTGYVQIYLWQHLCAYVCVCMRACTCVCMCVCVYRPDALRWCSLLMDQYYSPNSQYTIEHAYKLWVPAHIAGVYLWPNKKINGTFRQWCSLDNSLWYCLAGQSVSGQQSLEKNIMHGAGWRMGRQSMQAGALGYSIIMVTTIIMSGLKL